MATVMLRALLVVAAALLDLVTGLPAHAEPATVIKRQLDLLSEYDFIVAGAGTAGLTLADRLSESGEYTVLVVEYGYLDSSFAITATGPDAANTAALSNDLNSATRMYNVTSAPLNYLAGTTRNVACGCVVGGSSAVNGMFFDRGSYEDYDAWTWAAGEKHQAEYAKEWGWSNIYPFFKKSVTFHPPTEKMQKEYQMTYDLDAYGGTTPIHSSYAPFQWPTQQGIWDAWKKTPGIPVRKEGADGNKTGLLWCPNSINPVTRTRSYARLGHFENAAKSRANFHLLPAHRVTRVQLDESKDDEERKWAASGVYITPRDGEMFKDGPLHIKAKKEVIVSAGSVHTPQVLQRSGIGPKDVLESAGVDVRVELPGVGWNLQDHAHWQISWKFNTDMVPNPNDLSTNASYAQDAKTEWDASKSGPLSANVNSGVFLPLSTLSNRSEEIVTEMLAQDPTAYLPKGIHPTLVAGYSQQLKTMAKQFRSKDSAVLEWLFRGATTFSLIMIKYASRGTIYITADDDGAGRGNKEPAVDWRTFANPVDGEIATEILKFSRWFLTSPPMMETFHPTETGPGDLVQTDEDLLKWIKERISPSNGHLVGTAAIGPVELGGVVGPDLRVHGTQRLSVADNSIMTIIPGTHTSSTAYAIGEKAADMVLRRARAGAAASGGKRVMERKESGWNHKGPPDTGPS